MALTEVNSLGLKNSEVKTVIDLEIKNPDRYRYRIQRNY